jgi:hypothetical protein
MWLDRDLTAAVCQSNAEPAHATPLARTEVDYVEDDQGIGRVVVRGQLVLKLTARRSALGSGI